MRYLIILIAAFCLTGTSCTLNAQVNVNVNFNLGSQPIWGPTGYDYVENYYIPDIDVYYNVPQHRYYYFEGGLWIGRAALPVRFHNYSLFNVYKIVINEREPWHKHKMWKSKYASYRGRHDQMFIRDSRDAKYFVVKGHPQHQKWLKEKNGKGNQNGPNMRNTRSVQKMDKNMGGMNQNNGGRTQGEPRMQKQGKSQGEPRMQERGNGGGGKENRGGGGNKGGKGGGGGKGGK